MRGWLEIVGQLMCSLGVRFRVSHRSLIGFGLLYTFAASFLLALPNVGAWSLYVADALLAMAFGASTMCLAMSTEVVRSTESAQAVALVKAALVLGNVIGRVLYSCLSALFQDSSYPGAIFLVLSLVALVGLGLCCTLPSQQQLNQIRDSVRSACDAESEC
jgi:predicted MFS family arabinose efflux permease